MFFSSDNHARVKWTAALHLCFRFVFKFVCAKNISFQRRQNEIASRERQSADNGEKKIAMSEIIQA